jgi:alkanesulfonate monooxygenase SsuD/methylene tetrahydromethanopterin reductase-like flavin-dependent oxidoreductase (luciferase family)
MTTKRKIHLLGFVQHGVMNHASTMWAHPRDKVGYHWSRPEYWRDLGRIMERGLFDAMFIADELAPYTTYKGSSDPVVKYAGQCPVHEPATLVPLVGAFTKHLGIGITLSTSFIPPYMMARHLSTLEVDFQGQFFRCKGRHFVAPSPQRRPVLWQAGSSDQGREFAAKHAESVFGIFPTPKTMRAYAEDIRNRAANHGRDPDSVKLIYGLQTIIDRDKSRANDRYAEFVENVQIESALGILSGHTGFDFSTLDLDDNVVDADVQGIRGLFDAILEAKDGAPVTVREAAQIYGVSMGAPVAVGTPTDVADQMEEYIDNGDCNGFMMLATDTPGCFNDMVELLVPELQRRGRFRTRYPGTTLRESLQEY